MISNTPTPPYYAVIFTSKLNSNIKGYEKMSEKLDMILKDQSGFLGMESSRDEIGITVSYWKDLDSINKWKNNAVHQEARKKGNSEWYSEYTIRIALVERAYSK